MKKKKQIKELKRVFNDAVKRNFGLLRENARQGCFIDSLTEGNKQLREGFESAQCANKKLREENAKLKLENDLARAQLLDLQEKIKTPVFVPIK